MTGRQLREHIALLEQRLATLRRDRHGRRSVRCDEQADNKKADEFEPSLEDLEAWTCPRIVNTASPCRNWTKVESPEKNGAHP